MNDGAGEETWASQFGEPLEWGPYTAYSEAPLPGWWPVLGLTVTPAGDALVWIGEADAVTSESGGWTEPTVLGVAAGGWRAVADAEGVQVLDAPTLLGDDPQILAGIAQRVAAFATILSPLIGRVRPEMVFTELKARKFEDEDDRKLAFIAYVLLLRYATVGES
jgi:hypothetical protein